MQDASAMTQLTIQISDDVVNRLLAEAASRRLTVEEVAAEFVTHPRSGATGTRPRPEIAPSGFGDRPDLLYELRNVIGRPA